MTATLQRPPDSLPQRPPVEEVVTFGPEENLVGILTVPSAAASDRPAVVFLNAGVVHRIGPHRLHVGLARRLAARGHPCLRMDVSGVGDSRLQGGTRSFRASAAGDARLGMDALATRTGARGFLLVGLCSGADNGVATALADDRVAGLVLLEPHAYPTVRSRLRKLAARVRTPGDLVEVVGQAAQRVRARLAPGRGAGEPPAPPSSKPAPEVFGGELAAVLARGTDILAVYAGGQGERYNHPDQIFELFPRLRGRLERRWFPDANHTFTELAAQAALFDEVDGWVARHFR